MLRWGKGKEKKPAASGAPAPPAADDELAFLRSRADFDEEEMASVRSEPAPPRPPGRHPEAPAAPAGGDDWAFLRTRAQEEGVASVFTPPDAVGTEPLPLPDAPAAQPAPAAEPDPLTAEDMRLAGLVHEVTGRHPVLSEEDLRIGDLLDQAMGNRPPDRQGEGGR